MLDKIFGLLNPQTANAINTQGQQNDFNKALQLNQPQQNEAVAPVGSNIDLNTYKLRGTLDDGLDLENSNALQGIIAQLMNNPNILSGLMAKLKEKMGNVQPIGSKAA